MKFNKFLLSLLIVILFLNVSSINAYAAESTDNQTQENTTDDANNEATDDANNEAIDEAKNDANDNATVNATDKKNDNVTDKKTENKADNKTENKVDKKTDKKTDDKKDKVTYTKAELRLLSAIIYCEAGSETYSGKVAVGIVVMNRVKSKAFPDTVKGVIYQKYQFSPVRSGSLQKALAKYDNNRFTSTLEKDCIRAAKAVLSGTKSITIKNSKKDFSKYLYFSGKLKGYTYRLGHHLFK